MLCRMLEGSLKMLQNSIACFQGLHLYFVRFDVSDLLICVELALNLGNAR
jgi:hypothetical protein